jgi:hypothetical protein
LDEKCEQHQIKIAATCFMPAEGDRSAMVELAAFSRRQRQFDTLISEEMYN